MQHHGVWWQGTQPDKGGPLPGIGKVVARYKGRRTEARLQLPIASTRGACTEELAPVGWLTVGLLATDGIAVQVLPGKVQVSAEPLDCTKDPGCDWCNAGTPLERGQENGGAGQGARRVVGIPCGWGSSDHAQSR